MTLKTFRAKVYFTAMQEFFIEAKDEDEAREKALDAFSEADWKNPMPEFICVEDDGIEITEEWT